MTAAAMEYKPGDPIRVSFTATVTAIDSEGSLLACRGDFNGGYSFLIPPGATIEHEPTTDEVDRP